MASNQYDLLYGGGYSIKEYYMESGNPRQMRGASGLLSESAQAVADVLKKEGVHDDKMIVSGASLSALVSAGKGDALAMRAEKIFRDKCQTASVAFVSVPLEESYEATRRRAIEKYECRRGMKFMSWEMQDAQDDSILKNPSVQKSDSSEALAAARPMRCPRCRLRTPHYFISHENGEKQFLCTSCAKRELKSGREKYYERTIDPRESERDYKLDFNHEISTLSHLAEENRVALLYADINNLGAFGKNIKEFEEDKRFHEDIQSIVATVVFTALGKAMKLVERNKKKTEVLDSQFEIIALAGDDICLLLPGSVALLTAQTIAEEFDNMIAVKFPEKRPDELTISVAACVGTDTTALTYMEQLVKDRLHDAKKHAGKNSKSVVSLSFIEHPSSLFPMTSDKLKEFTTLLKEAASVAPTALRNIAEARRELVLNEEFSLYFDYDLSRLSEKREDAGKRAVLSKIHEQYPDEKFENPWSDFVLWQHQKLSSEEVRRNGAN
jgi:hypothetical protein